MRKEIYSKIIERHNEAGNLYTKVIAKALPSYNSGSVKKTHLHITTVEVNDRGSYAMVTHDPTKPCLRLQFSKPYGSNQTKAMMKEIKQLAKERYSTLLEFVAAKELKQGSDKIGRAFLECLKTLELTEEI